MALPTYKEIEIPLLCLIYASGGARHEISSSDAYNPLADYFGLSEYERSVPLPMDQRRSQWNNMVQWARRELKDNGYLAITKRGQWRLSAAGITAAQSHRNGPLLGLRPSP
jgi:5-methylcytosine-specific restriction protein A